MNTWQLQEAKSKFSKVFDEAIKKGPQIVMRRGVDKVVILSLEKYKEITSGTQKTSVFFHESPLSGVDIDLLRNKSMPRKGLKL